MRDPGDFEALNVRGKLLLQSRSIDGLRTLFTVNHSDYTAPQTENVNRPFGDYHSDFTFEPVFEPKTTSLIADTQYVIDPRFTFQAVLSGTDLSVARKAQPGDGIVSIDGREYVFEPRVNFKGEGRASGVAGVYLFRADQDEFIDFPSPQNFDDRVTTAAAFGEGTLPLNEVLDLTLGVRFEQEKHERHGGDQTLVREASLSTRYAGSYYSDIENNPRGKVGPYFVANAQAGYTVGPMRVYARVDNLFDSNEPMALYSGATEAEDVADILRPRTYWAGVQLSFR